MSGEENGGSGIARQVQYLTQTLRDAHQLMQSNERLLAGTSQHLSTTNAGKEEREVRGVNGCTGTNTRDEWTRYQEHEHPQLSTNERRCPLPQQQYYPFTTYSHKRSGECPADCSQPGRYSEGSHESYETLKQQLNSLKDKILEKEEEITYQRERDHLLNQLHKIEQDRNIKFGSHYGVSTKEPTSSDRQKLKDFEEEIIKLTQRLADTEKEMKDQNEKLIKRDFEKDVQLQKCQSLIIKLECELCEALENLKQLSVDKLDLTSEIGGKERLANDLYVQVDELMKKNKSLQDKLATAAQRQKEDDLLMTQNDISSCTSSHVTDEATPPIVATCCPSHIHHCKCVHHQSAVNVPANNCCLNRMSVSPSIVCKCVPDGSPNGLTKNEEEKRKAEEERIAYKMEITSLKDEIFQLKMQLLDEKSMLDVVRQQNQEAIVDHQKLGSDLTKSLEDSEKLRRKYIRAKKHFEEKAVLLEETITEAHCNEIDTLRQQLLEMEQNFAKQLQEQEGQNLLLNKEVDSLIIELGGQNTQILSSSFKVTPSCMMTKLRWLWKELTGLKQEQAELYKTLKEQKNTNMILTAKLQAFNEELLSGPKQSLLHQTF